jgi:formate dehydrogenase assembly factor FdhD
MRISYALLVLSLAMFAFSMLVKSPENAFLLFFGFGFLITSSIVKELEDIKEILKEKE